MEMFRAIVVDDEPEIREGLRSFDFAALGIELAGCYENGIIAYERILIEPVDLVITDIRMPLMDGLELSERLRKEFNFIQTIILTGYDEFDYARKSLQNGVFDYLLKPIDFGDLTASLIKVTALLTERKQIQLRNIILERKAKLSASLLRRSFLQDLLNRTLTPDEIEEGCSAGEIILDSPVYTVAVMRLDAMTGKLHTYPEKDWNLILLVLDNVISDMWTGKYGYHYVNRQSGSCYFLAVNTDIQSGDQLLPVLQAIKQAFMRFRGLLRTTLSLAAGPVVDQTHHLPLSRCHAETILAASPEPDTCSRYNSDHFNADLIVSSDAPNAGLETTSTPASYSDSGRMVIDEAKRYINENYERTITLRDVAQIVHVNPSYLSFLFKKVTGENFVAYLTVYRMRKAKILLMDLRHKIYEVGELVGYENPRYFCEIFKKHTGTTPHEYRDQTAAAGKLT